LDPGNDDDDDDDEDDDDVELWDSEIDILNSHTTAF
jgi:hypothetical protein